MDHKKNARQQRYNRLMDSVRRSGQKYASFEKNEFLHADDLDELARNEKRDREKAKKPKKPKKDKDG